MWLNVDFTGEMKEKDGKVPHVKLAEIDHAKEANQSSQSVLFRDFKSSTLGT